MAIIVFFFEVHTRARAAVNANEWVSKKEDEKTWKERGEGTKAKKEQQEKTRFDSLRHASSSLQSRCTDQIPGLKQTGWTATHLITGWECPTTLINSNQSILMKRTKHVQMSRSSRRNYSVKFVNYSVRANREIIIILIYFFYLLALTVHHKFACNRPCLLLLNLKQSTYY